MDRGGVRWAGAGIADQGVIALANAGTTLLAAALFHRERSAGPILAITIAYFVIGINRAFVGEVFTALASRLDGEDREDLVRQGLASSALIGVVAGVAFLAVWGWWPHHTVVDLRDLLWLAPFIPFVLLQDAGRYRYLADRRPAQALIIDLVWIGTQATVLVGSIIAVGPYPEWLLIAWGLGATASVVVFLIRTKPAFWRGDPRRWVRQTRQLSAWFTATALIGQLQTLLVNLLITGQVSKVAISGFRLAQTVLLAPVQNFLLAVQGLLVPFLSRMVGASAMGTFRRQVRNVSLGFVGLAVVVVSILWPLGNYALTNTPKFADIAPLSLPISLQAGIYLVQVPFTAALRAMHRAKMLFVQYALFTTVSLSGMVFGADQWGLPGAAWGLAAGSATGLAVMVASYCYAVRHPTSSPCG